MLMFTRQMLDSLCSGLGRHLFKVRQHIQIIVEIRDRIRNNQTNICCLESGNQRIHLKYPVHAVVICGLSGVMMRNSESSHVS